ncbi:MAG: sigma-70 family RNA polymerase sigma factor [Candidatus Dadabacteria bacterium]|nr:MAG: sigma-70 family RNA polymerase sigma factor [Candidatus Dadabacteria bacterium]
MDYMSALPASKKTSLRSKKPSNKHKNKRSSTRRAAKKAEGKIVDLFSATKRSKKDQLTDAQREQLVITYRIKARKLARSILRKWHARLDLQEVDSIVDLSLCEAVIRFKPSKGASFITFMYYHLRGNLIRAISTAANANTIPVTDGEIETRAARETESFKLLNARGVSAIEVAEALCNRDSILPDEVLFRKQLINLSLEACEQLDSLEREVIKRIYLGEEPLMEVAKSLGYSRCHISRVKKKALDTLNEEMNRLTGLEGDRQRSTTRKTPKNDKRVYRRRPRIRKVANSDTCVRVKEAA